jgi:hypothetical protein
MLTKLLTLFAGVSLLSGCAAQTPQPMRRCEGKKTTAEAIETLNSRRDKALPIRATGQCLLRYHAEGKEHKENFPVKLWFNPPDEIYLQGDIAFNAAGLVIGSNAEEFWFWLKPKEISSYWWGKWSQAGVWNRLAISPIVLLEAFGDVNVRQGDWALSRSGDFDLLSLYNEQNALAQKVYIERCDYIVAKDERLDAAGDIFFKAQFADYEKISEGFLVPKQIKMTAVSDDANEDSVEISLVSVQPTQLGQQQRQRLFVRPKPLGFDHVYKIVNVKAIEQTPE